jgi:nucleotide-binding universal stress UspA family protein
MEAGLGARSVEGDPPIRGATVSTILIGVDATERSEDAIAFGRRLASIAGADVIVACAFPFSDIPTRTAVPSYRAALAEDATNTAAAMRDRLGDVRAHTRIVANPSAAHALHDLAEHEHAGLIVVGSTHTGRAGRVLPGATGERLLHGAPCSVAIIPQGYRNHAKDPIRRIGVAYNGSAEAEAALDAAAELARVLGAELELIGVVSSDYFGTPALMGGPSEYVLREDVERWTQESLDAALASLPAGLTARSVRLEGAPAEQLAEHSAGLDLLVTGSRGYGPLRSVLVGGVSGRLVRSAHCPVIVVPRGVEAPLSTLFDGSTTTAV